MPADPQSSSPFPSPSVAPFLETNYPSIDYSELIVDPGGEQAATDFLDKTMDIFLYQDVYEDTRVRQGQNPSKLHYIFTDEET